MHNKTKFNIISFYEFINLTELEQLKSELIHFLKKRILIWDLINLSYCLKIILSFQIMIEEIQMY